MQLSEFLFKENQPFLFFFFKQNSTHFKFFLTLFLLWLEFAEGLVEAARRFESVNGREAIEQALNSQ